MVVWVSAGQDGDQGTIMARLFAADGSPFGPEFVVNTITAGDQVSPRVAVAPSGSFTIVWSGPDGDGSGIFARRYSSFGGPLGPEFPVNTTTLADQHHPTVSVDFSGVAVVVWEGQDGEGKGVFAQRYGASGAALGSELRVNTMASGAQTRPAAAPGNGGGFWIAFEQRGEIFLRRLTTGGALNPLVQVNTTTAGRQSAPAAASDFDGNLVVVWQDESGGDPGGGIRGRRGARGEPHHRGRPGLARARGPSERLLRRGLGEQRPGRLGPGDLRAPLHAHGRG